MNKFTFEDLKGKVCVLTGGAGVIGASLARGLASAGVKTAIVDINEEAAVKLAAQVEKESGVKCIGISANVLDKESLEAAKSVINRKLSFDYSGVDKLYPMSLFFAKYRVKDFTTLKGYVVFALPVFELTCQE
jgi:NAD(P)-dependent dehydrogenase (short-subunit alcohol dehydrogenase family)